MKKKIKDLTLEECNNICKQYDMCNSRCPFWTSKGCKKLIDVFYYDTEVEVEVKDSKESSALEAFTQLCREAFEFTDDVKKNKELIEAALKIQEERNPVNDLLKYRLAVIWNDEIQAYVDSITLWEKSESSKSYWKSPTIHTVSKEEKYKSLCFHNEILAKALVEHINEVYKDIHSYKLAVVVD